MRAPYDREVETRAEADQYARDRETYLRQIAYLIDRSPFYREKLHAAGFASAADVGGLDDLAALPFTTKDELRRSQAEHPPYGSHLAAPERALRRVYSTSGTTGEPCFVAVTGRDLDGWVEIGSRSYAAGGVRAGRPVVLTYNAGPFVAGVTVDSLRRLGATTVPVGSGNTERLVRACRRLPEPTVFCTPSHAVYLIEWCAARGIVPRDLGIARFCVAGEPGGGEEALRGRIQDAFGATVTEAMGIADASPSLWGECDDQHGMHWSGRDHVHVELVDPATGRPLPWADGAEGEPVYTALRREAMPLLRMRSGDRVVVNARPCRCGRTGVRVRCVGRTDDLLIVRGVNVFPTAVRAVVQEFRPHVSGALLIRPARPGVRQDVPPTVLVELPDGGAPDHPALAARIQAAIRDRLVAGTTVELVPYGTLPRSEYKIALVDRSAHGR